jgi:hypothetical protein
MQHYGGHSCSMSGAMFSRTRRLYEAETFIMDNDIEALAQFAFV